MLLLVLLACAPLVGLTLLNASLERRREVAAWRERSRQIVQLARREEEELVGQTRQLLLAVSESSAVRSTNRPACQASLQEVFASYPNYANLGLVDTNGKIFASALPATGPGDQPAPGLLRRVLETRAFAAGVYSAGLTNGPPIVSFGYPVFDRSGQVCAIVFASTRLDWFMGGDSQLAADVPDEANWLLIDRGGRVLVCHPASRMPSGLPFAGPTRMKTLLSKSGGIAIAPDSQGLHAVQAFEPFPSRLLPGSPVAVLSIPTQLLFAEANRSLARNLSWTGIAACLALALGWVGSSFLVIDPVKALVRASARVASGDLSTRTGLRHGRDELGQLTRTFDAMAQALEKREQERQHAEETLRVRDDMIREIPLIPAAVCVCDPFGYYRALQPHGGGVMGARAQPGRHQPAILRRATVIPSGRNANAAQ